MIKTTKGSDRKRKRRGGLLGGVIRWGKVMMEMAMGEDRETYALSTGFQRS